MFKPQFVVVLFLALGAAAYADHGKGSAGGKTISPRTLAEESFSIDTGFRYQRAESINDDRLITGAVNGHDVHSVEWAAEFFVGLSYGATDHLTVSLSLPFEVIHGFRAGEDDGVNPPAVVEATSISGMGDATLLGKYSLLSDPVELSVLAGVKIPTGNTGQHDNNLDLLEPDHQPGSGSWDPLLGVAAGRQFERFWIGASVLWRITSRGRHDFTPGQQVLFAVKADYQILGLGKFPRLYGSLELSEQFTAKDKFLSVKNQDTGGSIVGLGVGLRLRADEHMTIATTVTFPIYQGLYGEQHEERYEVLFGTTYDF